MKRNELSRWKGAGCAWMQQTGRDGRPRIGWAGLVLLAGALLWSAPVRAQADIPLGDQIYIYNANGPATNVTSLVYYVGQQAYLDETEPEPITVDYVVGHVYDQYGNLIGYVTESNGN